MNKKLNKVAEQGDEFAAIEIIRTNPDVDVNWQSSPESSLYSFVKRTGQPKGNKHTALHFACAKNYSELAAVLLAHPDILINKQDAYGWNAFMMTCMGGSTECARLMLRRPDAVIDLKHRDGYTPLVMASFMGHTDLIRWWIASGREMDFGTPLDQKTDPIHSADLRLKNDVAQLLVQVRDNEAETRERVRKELGYYDELASEVFAQVVFLSDGLLRIKRQSSLASRFFAITGKLPLEMQMVVCYRLVGQGKEIIPQKASETAFRDLAAKLFFLSRVK